MKKHFQKLSAVLSPLLSTGAVGVCPLCWAGSAAFLNGKEVDPSYIWQDGDHIEIRYE